MTFQEAVGLAEVRQTDGDRPGSGRIEVTYDGFTDDGAWVVPPHCGVWIPAHKPHSVRMVGVSTRSLYIEPAAAPRAAEPARPDAGFGGMDDDIPF